MFRRSPQLARLRCAKPPVRTAKHVTDEVGSARLLYASDDPSEEQIVADLPELIGHAEFSDALMAVQLFVSCEPRHTGDPGRRLSRRRKSERNGS